MSKQAAEHHHKAAEHHEHAARHHREAATHHEAGKHETAAHHAHMAQGHHQHATHHASEAAKAHIDRAYALAQMLAQQSITYRPSRLAEFARLSFEVDSRIETFLVSVIDDSLIVPA